MVVRAMRLLTSTSMQARLYLKKVRMKLLFFPSMAVRTFIFELASILIRSNEVFCMPVCAHLLCICENCWLSPIILPVMSIHTHVPFVVIFSVWTPYCFEMEDIKIHIRFKFFNELDRQIVLLMCERTEFTIFAFRIPIQVWRTEFCFIFVRMIEFFNSVVSLIAWVLIRAFLMIFNIPTFFWLIKSQWSSPIFFIVVIKWTLFKIMVLRIV